MVIPEIMYRNARKYPNKQAVVFKDKSWTYKELDLLSNKFANALLSAGLQKGDHVSLMMTNSEKFIVAYFGIQKAGAVVATINSKYMKPEVAYIVKDSDSKFLVYSSDFVPVLDGLDVPGVTQVVVGDVVPKGALSYEEIMKVSPDSRPPVEVTEDDFSTILYTSGTTGNPSGAIFTHRAVNYDAYTAGTINHRLSNFSRNLIMMPLFHSAPLHNHMLGTMWPGGTVVILAAFDLKDFLETIEREKTTHFFGPAMVYLNCVKQFDVSKYDLSSMQMFVMGGSPCAAEDQERIIREMKLKGRFMQVYGLTESGPFGSALVPEEIDYKPASIGTAGSIGAELIIVDEQGEQITEPDVVGELAVFAESHMTEYYHNPEKTAKTLINGWIMTGDLAKYDSDGYIYFMDRTKDMIISGGQNIFSKEVEDVIMAFPGVLEVAVIGIPHKEWGESVKAVVSPVPGSKITPAEIKEFVSDKLAKFKRPRYVDIVESIPHNPAGKIVKPEVRKLYPEAADSQFDA